jgi:hypothetical protein
VPDERPLSIDEQRRLEQGREYVAGKVSAYLSDENYYRSSAFSETSTRTNFIDPFLSAPSWNYMGVSSA